MSSNRRTARHALPHHLIASIVVLAAGCGVAIAQSPAGGTAAPGNNLVLIGRVVTMNASRDILNSGAIWIRDGQIVAVANGFSELEAAVRDLPPTEGPGSAVERLKSANIVRLNGAIYPGMIDLHNHPDYAIYPLLPIKRKYKDRYEWHFYDDAYARRITNLNTLLTAPQYLDLSTEVGRYGEIKALVGGTTTMQGSRPTLPSAKEACLVRNIETETVTARPAFSRVDIGRDAAEWQRMADERRKGPLVVHLAEGVGPRMAAEFDAVKRSGLLGPELVAIHGVGLTVTQLTELATAGGKLVWSPLSNFMLYGQTADVVSAHRAGVLLSLAPDWTPSGSKSILGELKVADLVNQRQLNRHFSDRELVEMVTINPAQAIGWGQRLGQISAGFLADLIVIDDLQPDAYRNLIQAVEANVQLVVVRGDALYGDRPLIDALRDPSDVETLASGRSNIHRAATREKRIAPNCEGTTLPRVSVVETSQRIQRALDLKSADIAQRISAEQMAKDIAPCARPNEVVSIPGAPSSADAKRFLACRFQLPFERTTLSPLITADDPQYFARLLANPNLPRYFSALPRYYANGQGASRSNTQPSSP